MTLGSVYKGPFYKCHQSIQPHGPFDRLGGDGGETGSKDLASNPRQIHRSHTTPRAYARENLLLVRRAVERALELVLGIVENLVPARSNTIVCTGHTHAQNTGRGAWW